MVTESLTGVEKELKQLMSLKKQDTLIALKDVTDNHDLMIITQYGNILRSPVSGIKSYGKSHSGRKIDKS